MCVGGGGGGFEGLRLANILVDPKGPQKFKVGLHQPVIETGSAAWEAAIIPLDHWCHT